MINVTDIYDLTMVYNKGSELKDRTRCYYTLKICFKSELHITKVSELIKYYCNKYNLEVLANDLDQSTHEYYFMFKCKYMDKLIEFIKELPNKNKLNVFIATTLQATGSRGYHIGFREGKLIEAIDNQEDLVAFRELYLGVLSKLFIELKQIGLVEISIPSSKIKMHLNGYNR